MPFQITLRFAAVFKEFTLVFLFFTSLLLHHSMDSEYHSVAYSTSVTSLELGESYAGPEYATPAAEALIRLRHLSRRTDICCGTELISESELESESEMPFRFRR